MISTKRDKDKVVWAGAIVLGLTVLILYGSVVKFGFINYDDDWLILENKYVHGLTLKNITRILFFFDKETRTELGAEYLPVRDILSALDWAIWHGKAFGFHLTNLLLYLVQVLLLYIILLELGTGAVAALLACLLFAVHPSHVSTVAWITARKNLLALLFMLAAYLYYMRWTRSDDKNILYISLSCLLMLMGCFSKQFVVVFPLLAFAHEIIIEGRSVSYLYKERKGIALLFVIAAAAAFIHIKVGHMVGMFEPRAYKGLYAVLFSVELIRNFVSLLLFPVYKGMFFVDPWSDYIDISKVTLSVVAVVSLSLLCVCLYKRGNKRSAFGIAWFLICILPFIQITPTQNKLTWRYLYPASVSLSFIVAELCSVFEGNNKRLSTFLLVFMMTLLSLFAWLTTSRVRLWKDPEIFWLDAIEHRTTLRAAYINLGKYYKNIGDKKKSIAVAKAYVRNMPHDYKAHMILALRCFDAGDIECGRRETKKALKLNPHSKEALLNWGYYEMEQKNYEKAEEIFKKVIKLDPNYAKPYNNLGVIYKRQNKLNMAAKYYAKALELNPHYIVAAVNLASVEMERRNINAAKKILKEVLRLSPVNAEAKKLLLKLEQLEKVYKK